MVIYRKSCEICDINLKRKISSESEDGCNSRGRELHVVLQRKELVKAGATDDFQCGFLSFPYYYFSL